MHFQAEYCYTKHDEASTKRLTCLPASQDVHEGGFASPTDPHEAGEHPRAEGTADTHQQL